MGAKRREEKCWWPENPYRKLQSPVAFQLCSFAAGLLRRIELSLLFLKSTGCTSFGNSREPPGFALSELDVLNWQSRGSEPLISRIFVRSPWSSIVGNRAPLIEPAKPINPHDR